MIPSQLTPELAVMIILGVLAVARLVKSFRNKRAHAGLTTTQTGLSAFTSVADPQPILPVMSARRSPSPSGKASNIVRLKPVTPILVVEHAGDESPLLSLGFRNAGFINPIISLPDDHSLSLYLDGVGIYANRKKYPLPILILQDVTLPKPDSTLALSWLQDLPTCRQVVVTYFTAIPNPQHFESAVAFGPNAILCKLQFPDSVDALFRSLHRACIED
jgi:hypothetical protein